MENTVHDSCAWAEQPQSSQQPIAIRIAEQGVVVHMVCPRCRGLTVSRVMPVVPGPGGYKGPHDHGHPPTGPGSRFITFLCACGLPHSGRPDNAMEHGCGAYWKAAV
jgi:hypothetical protein